MSAWGRRRWLGLAAAVVFTAGGCWFLVAQGPERASWWAGIGSFVLAAAASTLRRGSRPAGDGGGLGDGVPGDGGAAGGVAVGRGVAAVRAGRGVNGIGTVEVDFRTGGDR